MLLSEIILIEMSVEDARQLIGQLDPSFPFDNVTKQAVSKARRNIAKILHPDRGGDEEQMKRANDALDVLKKTGGKSPEPVQYPDEREFYSRTQTNYGAQAPQQTYRSRREAEWSKAIKEFYKMPKKVMQAVDDARSNLWHGNAGQKYGWKKALEIINNWMDEVGVGSLYYDSFAGYVTDHEPEGYEDEETGEWIEPSYEDFVHLERRDVKRALFGDLAEYLD